MNVVERVRDMLHAHLRRTDEKWLACIERAGVCQLLERRLQERMAEEKPGGADGAFQR